MVSAVPATVASGLISRLNSLRLRRGDERAHELAQITFSAQGLRKADSDAYLAVQSMIAVVAQDWDALRDVAAQILSTQASLSSRLNVLRSLAIANEAELVNKFTALLVEEIPGDLRTAMILTDSALTCGQLTHVLKLAERHSEISGTELLDYEDARLAQKFLANGTTDREFCEFLNDVDSSMCELGYPTAPFSMGECLANIDDDPTIAYGRIMIDANDEEMGSLEENFYDAMLRRGSELFTSGKVVCSMSLELA